MAQAPTGDEAKGLLLTGSGVWEGDLTIGAGRSVFGGKGWGFVEVGPQFQGGGLEGGIVYAAQVGWTVSRRLALTANARGVEPYSQAPPDVLIGSPVGVSDRVTTSTMAPAPSSAWAEAWG